MVKKGGLNYENASIKGKHLYPWGFTKYEVATSTHVYHSIIFPAVFKRKKPLLHGVKFQLYSSTKSL